MIHSLVQCLWWQTSSCPLTCVCVEMIHSQVQCLWLQTSSCPRTCVCVRRWFISRSNVSDGKHQAVHWPVFVYLDDSFAGPMSLMANIKLSTDLCLCMEMIHSQVQCLWWQTSSCPLTCVCVFRWFIRRSDVSDGKHQAVHWSTSCESSTLWRRTAQVGHTVSPAL